MLTHEQNETLTRVGPGTAMGNLMRRYWVPFALAWELPDADCPPIEVRLLGEDLVAFRDTSGTVGLISAYCAHRRVSMFWGRTAATFLRLRMHFSRIRRRKTSWPCMTRHAREEWAYERIEGAASVY